MVTINLFVNNRVCFYILIYLIQRSSLTGKQKLMSKLIIRLLRHVYYRLSPCFFPNAEFLLA